MTAVWVTLLVFVAFKEASSAGFSVLAPQRSMSAWLGSSVTLRCTVSPPISVTNMEVRWYRPEDPKVPVLQRTSPDSQVIAPQYRGRVSLTGDLGKGDVSLQMENLMVADRGEYVCYVKSTDWYDTSTVTLLVTATGSAPLLSTAEAGEGQVNVTCASDGWSPEPKLTWTDRVGQNIPGNHMVVSADDQGLVRVSSWLLRSPSESEWVSCSVGLSDQERREGRILPTISRTQTGTNTSGAATGTAAFISTLLLLIALLLGAFVLYKKGILQFNSISKSSQEKYSPVQMSQSPGEPTELEYIPDTDSSNTPQVDEQTDNDADIVPSGEPDNKDNNTQGTETNAETAEKSAKDKAIVTPEWDYYEEYEVESIHFNPIAAPGFEKEKGKSGNADVWCQKVSPFLKVKTVEKKSPVDVSTEVWCPDPGKVQGGDGAAHVMFTEKFSSGQHCWRVQIVERKKIGQDKKINKKQSWYVGVCRYTSESPKKVSLTPANGFWLLRYEKGAAGLFANTDPPTAVPMPKQLLRLGVFLDCGKHTLSFYDVDNKSHLCTFKDVGVDSTLIPLVSPGVRDSEVMTVYVEKKRDKEKRGGNVDSGETTAHRAPGHDTDRAPPTACQGQERDSTNAGGALLHPHPSLHPTAPPPPPHSSTPEDKGEDMVK